MARFEPMRVADLIQTLSEIDPTAIVAINGTVPRDWSITQENPILDDLEGKSGRRQLKLDGDRSPVVDIAVAGGTPKQEQIRRVLPGS
jgi:hypothetical protein